MSQSFRTRRQVTQNLSTLNLHTSDHTSPSIFAQKTINQVVKTRSNQLQQTPP